MGSSIPLLPPIGWNKPLHTVTVLQGQDAGHGRGLTHALSIYSHFPRCTPRAKMQEMGVDFWADPNDGPTSTLALKRLFGQPESAVRIKLYRYGPTLSGSACLGKRERRADQAWAATLSGIACGWAAHGIALRTAVGVVCKGVRQAGMWKCILCMLASACFDQLVHTAACCAKCGCHTVGCSSSTVAWFVQGPCSLVPLLPQSVAAAGGEAHPVCH